MINNIKEFFTNIIYVRGLEYYQKGNVYDVFSSGNNVYGHIKGEVIYNTRITVENHKVTSSSCNCPYYTKDTPCKHAAALSLYEDNYNVKKSDQRNINDIIENMSKAELKYYLYLLVGKRSNKALKENQLNINREILSLNFIAEIDDNVELFENYIDNLLQNDLFTNQSTCIFNLLLKIAGMDLQKAYYLLSYIVTKDPLCFYAKALEFIDVTMIYYNNDTSISLVIDIIKTNDKYLESIINIYLKNNRRKLVEEIIDYLDSLILTSDSIFYKNMKLRAFLSYDKLLAKAYAKNNIDKGFMFLKTYVSIEPNYEKVVLDYLNNYNDDFITTFDELIDVLKESSKSDIQKIIKEIRG